MHQVTKFILIIDIDIEYLNWNFTFPEKEKK